jgi:signal transduction histidine kinase
MAPIVKNEESDQRRSAVGTSARTAKRLALFSWVLSMLFAAAALMIMVLGWSAEVPTHATMPVLYPVLLASAQSSVGALIASHRPENLIGWIMCADGLLIALNALAGSYAAHALYSGSEPMSGAALAAWANVFTGNILLFPLLLLLFPDGRLPSRRWRLVVWLILGTLLAEIAAWAFAPGRFPGWPPARNPFGVAVLEPLLNLYVTYAQTPLLVLAVLLPAVSLLMRFRGSRGVERQQIKWFVSSGVLVALAATLLFVVGTRSSELIEGVLWAFLVLAFCTLPASVGVAILRYRLWDIDLLINRALVYGALSAVVVGLYVLVVGSLGALLQARGSLLVSLLAAGLVAVLFAPLRERLQRGVNRLMYGERDDPYAVLSRLGQRLEATLEPSAVLQTIVETVAQALKLPYVAVALQQDGELVTAAEYGTSVGEPTIMPLVYQKETVGGMILSPRTPKEPFSPADRHLLEDLARHAEVAVHAVRLTADLQRSRERLVTTREEERRRLRRDLHDGLGPQLATQTLKLDAARNLLMHEPKAADALLGELKAETQAAIADIRRLVYALRPPALDELGLVSAIHEQATNYGLPQRPEGETDHANTVVFSLEAPDQAPPLPAAVEVAAYRIAQEAITNVARHARARTCRIRISLGKELQLEIIDDGVGLPLDRHAGVGLTSMRERAAELGGSCVIEPMPTGGTRVLVRLPLPPSEE